MWKAIGVQAELVNREVKVHYDELKQNNFDIARAAWVADYNDPQNFLYLLETRTGVQNYGRYSNSEYVPKVETDHPLLNCACSVGRTSPLYAQLNAPPPELLPATRDKRPRNCALKRSVARTL